MIYKDRFNLSAADRDLGVGDPGAPLAPAPVGGPLAEAWRTYARSVFKKGFMHKLSCRPSVTFYVAENKTLASKEDNNYESEAFGRKLALSFF